MKQSTDRLTAVVVAAMFGYIVIEYVAARMEAFDEWYKGFVAPFIRHPGRREFLRETLMREEMTVKVKALPCEDCDNGD